MIKIKMSHGLKSTLNLAKSTREPMRGLCVPPCLDRILFNGSQLANTKKIDSLYAPAIEFIEKKRLVN